MKKAEIKERIKDGMRAAYGFAPQSRQIRIRFATESGTMVLFSVSGIPYSMKEGEVRRDDGRSSTRKEDKSTD